MSLGGTAYDIRVLEDKTTIVTVYEGTVRVSDPQGIQRVIVVAGYRLTVKPGELPGQPERHSEIAPEKAFYAPGPGPANISTPNALAAYEGVAFGVVSTHGHGTETDTFDAVIAGGIGFLEPGHGLEVALTMGDVSRIGSFFPSVRWQVQPETFALPAVAIGVEDLGNLQPEQCQQTPYVVATKTFFRLSENPTGATTVVSAGFGGRRFGNRLFASACTTINETAKFIAEYDGRGINTGGSFAFLELEFPVTAIVGITKLDSPSERLWTIAVGRQLEFGAR